MTDTPDDDEQRDPETGAQLAPPESLRKPVVSRESEDDEDDDE